MPEIWVNVLDESAGIPRMVPSYEQFPALVLGPLVGPLKDTRGDGEGE